MAVSLEKSGRRFTEETYDKFKERTDVEWVDPLSGKWFEPFWSKRQTYNDGEMDRSFNADLLLGMRHTKTPTLDITVIDYSIQSLTGMGFGSGEMIVNLDNSKNIHLGVHQTRSEMKTEENPWRYDEKGYWQISKEQILEICAAKKIEIRIFGSSDPANVPSDGNLKFHFMCRSFASEVLDEHAYDEWINSIVPVGSEGQKDNLFMLILGYLLSWFLFPLGILIGLVQILRPITRLDGKLAWAHSTEYRIHGVIMIALGILAYLWKYYH